MTISYEESNGARMRPSHRPQSAATNINDDGEEPIATVPYVPDRLGTFPRCRATGANPAPVNELERN